MTGVEYECRWNKPHALRRYAAIPVKPPQCCGAPMVLRTDADRGSAPIAATRTAKRAASRKRKKAARGHP